MTSVAEPTCMITFKKQLYSPTSFCSPVPNMSDALSDAAKVSVFLTATSVGSTIFGVIVKVGDNVLRA